MTKLFTLLFVFFNLSSFGEDLTHEFYLLLKEDFKLTHKEVNTLNQSRVVLVPGILSETFIFRDFRSLFDFSLVTKDYFGEYKAHLKNTYNLDVIRASSSSKSIEEIKTNLAKIINTAHKDNKKVIFVTHSLGGLALLDLYIENPEFLNHVRANVFIQSPFYGSPVADTYLENPYFLKSFLKPILPLVNTSEEVISYLQTKSRKKVMQDNLEKIQNIMKTPSLFITSTANTTRSIFRPSLDLMEYGCIRAFEKCITKLLFKGPYSESDGMVPLKSGYIEGQPFVTLKDVDHGESVLNTFYDSISREFLSSVILKMLIILEEENESRSISNSHKSE